MEPRTRRYRSQRLPASQAARNRAEAAVGYNGRTQQTGCIMRFLRPAIIALLTLAALTATPAFHAEALWPVVDLSATRADVTVYGDDSGDECGWSVATGDINGDGTDDLIIVTLDEETDVIYGGGSLPATIDLDSTSPDLAVVGDDWGEQVGRSAAAGDINGDGTDDLIIGAYHTNPGGRRQAGETHVIYGGASLPAIIDLSSTSADLTVYGDDAEDYSGDSVAAGDINGDGTDDLIIGAWGADPGGETYVIYGGGSLPATIDLDSTSPDLTVRGDDWGDQVGRSAAVGAIDGDGTDDLIIGAFVADPVGGSNAGETYVIYGGTSLPAIIDLSSASADLTVYGDDGGDLSGWAVATGDIDGDGTDDLIVGARGADPGGGSNAGETYVVYGAGSLPTIIDLNSTRADVTVYGDDAEDYSGNSVAAGDIDGNGTDDLIIGAWGADPAGRSQAGETYVISGGESVPAFIDLDNTSADLTVFGGDVYPHTGEGSESGRAVGAGDINGDGTDDLIIGANAANTVGGGNAGETYVLYGRSPVGGIVELRTDPNAQSDQPASASPLPIGASVALGVLVLGAGGLCAAKLRRG